MAVSFYNHALIYQRRKEDIDGAIMRVLSSGRPDWGPEVPAFEAEFGAYLGAAHVVTVNSGTAALKIALLSLGIGRGDEVITVPNTDIGTVSAIHHTGATSVFVDVDPKTLTIDIEQVRAAIGPRTRAILPVDLYGQPARLVELMELARTHGLYVVEDACLALGARIGERVIGTLSDITCFSFAPTKHLGSLGSGGACVTSNADLASRMRKLSAYGQDRARHMSIGGSPPPLHHETEGLNERMDEIQAAILRVKLPDVADSVAARIRQAGIYQTHLSAKVEVPLAARGTVHAFRNYVVHMDNRDAVRLGMTNRGLATALSYAPPLHLQPVYGAKGHREGAFPVSERSGQRLLGLPIGPHLSDAQIIEVANGLLASIEDVSLA
jgi:dTDP-4-amino-4,6-dideoxygalactose transaminase